MLKGFINYLWSSKQPVEKPIRKYGWKKDKYAEHDLATRPELSTFKKFTYHPMLDCVNEIDLSKYILHVKDQGKLGACVAHGITSAYEFCMVKQENLDVLMSRLFLYYLAREVEGTIDSDSGAEIHDGIKVTCDQGLCVESLWPYDISKFTDKPDDKCYDDLKLHKSVKAERVQQTLNDMKQCLLDGFPIVIGIQVYESFESDEVAKTGIVPMPNTSTEKLLGGHCVLMFSTKLINGKLYGGILNSWGPDWGAGGKCFIPMEYLTNPDLASDFWTIKLVDDEKDPNEIPAN